MFPSVALRVSRRSEHREHHHAAVVERGGAYLAMEANRKHLHAEVAALRKLWPSERRGTRVWSLRWTQAGSLGLAKPCAECEAFMRAAGVKAVWYSTATGEIAVLKL